MRVAACLVDFVKRNVIRIDCVGNVGRPLGLGRRKLPRLPGIMPTLSLASLSHLRQPKLDYTGRMRDTRGSRGAAIFRQWLVADPGGPHGAAGHEMHADETEHDEPAAGVIQDPASERHAHKPCQRRRSVASSKHQAGVARGNVQMVDAHCAQRERAQAKAECDEGGRSLSRAARQRRHRGHEACGGAEHASKLQADAHGANRPAVGVEQPVCERTRAGADGALQASMRSRRRGSAAHIA